MKSHLTWFARQSSLVTWLCAASLALASAGTVRAEEARTGDKTEVKAAELGSTPNVHAAGSVWLCGQPTKEDLALAKEKGIDIVLTLRGQDEIDWDEAKFAKDLGLDFKRIAFRSPESLTDEVFDETRALLNNAKNDKKDVMVHCGSANRVGAIWLVHRMIDHGVAKDQAEKEAKEVGLRNEDYLKRALEYVAKKQAMPPR